GVDFWHAVEFSRNGRFLCTHPLGLSSGLSFCCVAVFLRFRLYQTLSRPTSSVLSGSGAFALSLSGDSDSIRSSPPDFPARIPE
ncbi:hypothetical protein, partial [Streptomyces sp. NPDC005533]|uniref:hypothetical protein n=1 Tax=Streptomyces sp. NPDC005533 TaxID=3364723 RepID=UPI003697C78E